MTRTVVYFCDSREFGGAEQVLLRVLADLDRRRWRPVLFHHGGPGLAPLLSAAREQGARLRTVPRIGSRRHVRRLPELVRAIREERPAVFHANLTWPLSCKFGIAAAALARVPAVVATVHLFPEVRLSRSRTLQHRVVTACVDRYVAVSREVAGRLHRSFTVPSRKTTVVPNGIDPARIGEAASLPPPPLPPQAAGRPLVLTAARLGKHKGHATLLEAAVRVPEAAFLLAGDGPERESLEARARELGVADRVFFLGYRADVPALLAACDLFVLPSFYEGLPLSVLEAMAAGKPVVGSAIGGTDEAVVPGETGLLVPPGDSAALAGAIRACLSDAELSRRFGTAGRERVLREFTAERMVHRVIQVYDELLPRPAPSAAARLAPAGGDP